LTFIHFLQIVEAQKRLKMQLHDDETEEWQNAFVALGASNAEGVVTKDALIKVVKNDWGLTIDLEELFERSVPGNEELKFKQFASVFSS